MTTPNKLVDFAAIINYNTNQVVAVFPLDDNSPLDCDYFARYYVKLESGDECQLAPISVPANCPYDFSVEIVISSSLWTTGYYQIK